MSIRTNESDDVIDQYLQGRLDTKELEDFELRMLEDPQFFKKVQQVELMHTAFKEQKPLFDETLKAHRSAKVLPFTLWIKQPMSLAASLLVAIGLAFTGMNYIQQVDELNTRAGYAVNSVVNVGQMRNASNDIVLTSGMHLLQVDVGIDVEQTAYLLNLRQEGEGTSQEFRTMPDGNGIVRLLTPSGLNGRYQLTVQKENGLEPVVSYQLRFE